jgi:secreted Zn-dependent insulinase-like peptidase
MVLFKYIKSIYAFQGSSSITHLQWYFQSVEKAVPRKQSSWLLIILPLKELKEAKLAHIVRAARKPAMRIEYMIIA